MQFFLFLCLCSLISISALSAPAPPNGDGAATEWPRTRPERTGNTETSTLADVNAFLDALQALGAPIARSVLGVSDGDREIPLVVCADPMVADGDDARASGRLVIYLQANIHGGEVEGKEAALMLLREIATGIHPQWLARCVFVCTPVYNVDGNEAWGEGLKNRGHQNGPARIGLRPNGAGLDLNRDCMKAESPEMRAALTQVYRHWDPHVVLDLHTTNGTRHGYTLTYAPPLHPDTDAEVLRLARDVLLPAARSRLADEFSEATNDYGNLETRNGARGWFSFSPLGRYVTNYVGLRNRIGILSEATSFLPLETRIASTRRFVATVIDLCARHAGEISSACREADRAAAEGRIEALSIAFAPASRGEESVPLEVSHAGRAEHESPGELVPETLPIYDRFEGTRTRSLPDAYWIPAAESPTIALLRRHGITVEPFRTEKPVAIERFALQTVERARRSFQGHRQVRVTGSWVESELTAKVASTGYLVTTRQPLARLVSHLLEPDLTDGAIAWELVESTLAPGGHAPIVRIR